MVKCDRCGYTVPIPSREGTTCNNTTGSGYCRGTLHNLEWHEERERKAAEEVVQAKAKKITK